MCAGLGGDFFSRSIIRSRQPLEPFPDRLASQRATVLLDENMQFAPRDDDSSAEKIAHEIERDLAAKREHTQIFPGQADQKDIIFALGAENFANLLQVGSPSGSEFTRCSARVNGGL
jgi:hypothetical protein